jgi:hypothetical protein
MKSQTITTTQKLSEKFRELNKKVNSILEDEGGNNTETLVQDICEDIDMLEDEVEEIIDDLEEDLSEAKKDLDDANEALEEKEEEKYHLHDMLEGFENMENKTMYDHEKAIIVSNMHTALTLVELQAIHEKLYAENKNYKKACDAR